jgi:hypothetical protein
VKFYLAISLLIKCFIKAGERFVAILRTMEAKGSTCLKNGVKIDAEG